MIILVGLSDSLRRGPYNSALLRTAAGRVPGDSTFDIASIKDIAAAGGMGTTFAQTAWLPVLRTLGTRPFFGKTLYVSGAGKRFDADGQLTDAALRERRRACVESFAAFAAR